LKAELDQARLAAIVESSSDAIVSRGMDGKVLSWNAAAEHMFGWSRQEALGQPITIIVPPERRGELRPLIERVVAGENIGVIESTHRRKNGTRIDTAITFSAIRDAAGNATAVSLIYRDITQQKLAEVALLESEQRFRAMIEQSISGFYVIQDDRFTYVNARFAEIFGYASSDEIVGKHPSELVAEKDRATVAGNIQRRLSREAMSLSYTFTGVRKDGKEVDIGVHGALATYQGQPVIMGLLQDISDRKLAEEQIRRYVAQLEQAMQSTINVVATIGELRDPYTHGHERRVGEIAAAIATEMGLDQNQVEGIRIAGYLHDVGKIAVPAEILAKPTKLTKAEFDLVKDHARQSYDILKTVPFPWPVAEAAWQHHERMDGSGYPRGLKGEEIIVESRILAVADTVEAMSSHRPYRPGLGIDKALAEIERSRGKLFCPEAADACLRLFREKGFTLPA
jgi:PAS domain S-box-containing protein